ncbi:TPA: hypothetical protein OMU21_004881 [Klebsiella aerogenes]|nr:hypothetical protein [Klebsiella aerogenes]
MIRHIHFYSSLLSALILASFWTSSLFSELFSSAAEVAKIKTTIAYALMLFIPAMVVTAVTGFNMGKKTNNPITNKKLKRMKIIGVNGLMILTPCAIFLSIRASYGLFDRFFYSIQMLEFLVGAINLTLIALNIRDGFRLAQLRTR